MKKIDLLKKIEEAKINQRAGNTLEANQTFQELLKSNGNSFDLLFAYGLFCRDLKNFNLAKRLFLNLINNFPSSISSYILLAEILRLENKLNEAERDQITMSMKVDVDSKMGIVSDVQQELREANARKVLYSSIKSVDL